VKLAELLSFEAISFDNFKSKGLLISLEATSFKFIESPVIFAVPFSSKVGMDLPLDRDFVVVSKLVFRRLEKVCNGNCSISMFVLEMESWLITPIFSKRS
jgi:hypothetical protein